MHLASFGRRKTLVFTHPMKGAKGGAVNLSIGIRGDRTIKDSVSAMIKQLHIC